MMNILDRNRRFFLCMICCSIDSAAYDTARTHALIDLAQSKSLADELAQALRNRELLMVMVSLHACPFCHEVRQNYLLPLKQAGFPIVQVDMRSSSRVRDFSGSETTHATLVRRWEVRLAPTVLFFGPNGREVAERLEGAYVPDFYGGYLDQRIATARAQVRAAGF